MVAKPNAEGRFTVVELRFRAATATTHHDCQYYLRLAEETEHRGFDSTHIWDSSLAFLRESATPAIQKGHHA